MAEMTGDMLRQKRDNFRVEMRKKQTEMILKQKRQTGPNIQNNQISEEKVGQWYKRLVNNDLSSTLTEIRLSLSGQSIEFHLSLINKHEVYPLIVNIWNTCNLDSSIIQQLLYILANLHSYNVFDDLALLKNEVAINKMIDLLQMTQFQQIQTQIFFLLANLVACDNGTKARTLADYGFCGLIKKMWTNQLIYFERSNIQDFCWFLSNFFSYKSSNIAGFTLNEVKDVLPVVLECINSNENEIQKYALLTLNQMFQAKEELFFLLMKQQHFLKDMQDLERNCKDQEVQFKIVEILAAFAISDDEITSKLVLDFNILDYFLQIYIQPGRSNQKDFKKVILWGLSNLCCNLDFKTLQKIVKHDLLKIMQQDGEQNDIIKDILEVIRSLSRMSDPDLLKYVLMNRNIPDIIINQLKQKLSKTIVLLCLEIVYNFASRIGKYSQSDINMAIEVFISKGFDQLLNQLEYDQDDQIVTYALKLNETFLQ